MRHVQVFENFKEDEQETLIYGIEDLGVLQPKYLVGSTDQKIFIFRFGGVKFRFRYQESFKKQTDDFEDYYDRYLRVPIPELEQEDLKNPNNPQNFFSKILQDSVLNNIRAGKVSIDPVEEDDLSVGDCLDLDHIKSTALKSKTLQEFWNRINRDLREAGKDAYKQEGWENLMYTDLDEYEDYWNQTVTRQLYKFWIEEDD
jgi:hypothetical protein